MDKSMTVIGKFNISLLQLDISKLEQIDVDKILKSNNQRIPRVSSIRGETYKSDYMLEHNTVLNTLY